MIRFIKHRNFSKTVTKVKRFQVRPGEDILKICFSRSDIHTARDGTMHLDIWGLKLRQLKAILRGKPPKGLGFNSKWRYDERGRLREDL
jgi:hypothetical protein